MNESTIQSGYFDGQSAMEKPVSVSFDAVGLSFETPDGLSKLWLYDELRLVSLQRDNGHVTLGWMRDDQVRLRLKNRDAGEQLFRLAPHLKAERPERGILKPIMVSAAIVAVLAGIYFSYPVLRSALIMSMPNSWVEALGDSAGSGFFEAAGRCEDPQGIDALETMTARLTRDVTFPYALDIAVVNMPFVNAFAAPGGRVVITRALIEKAESPDEVAGVLGHELGHVKHRHPLERMIDIYGFELLLGGIGGGYGSYGGLALMMKFSRDDEREADATSLEMLRDAEISSAGFADFFDRLSKDESNAPGFLAFMSTHPQPEEREQVIRDADGENGESFRPEPALNDREWQALQSICQGAPAPKANPFAPFRLPRPDQQEHPEEESIEI